MRCPIVRIHAKITVHMFKLSATDDENVQNLNLGTMASLLQKLERPVFSRFIVLKSRWYWNEPRKICSYLTHGTSARLTPQ